MLNPIPPHHNPNRPYQPHNPPKGEELDEFINHTEIDDDELEDYEHTETTINQPKHKFPDDDSNVGDDPIYPEDDDIVAEEYDLPDDDDETTISIGN